MIGNFGGHIAKMAGESTTSAESTQFNLIYDKLVSGIKEARLLRAVEDDESEPYKSKYAAADSLQSLEQEATNMQQLVQSGMQPSASALPTCSKHAAAGAEWDAAISQCVAHCQLERGLVLLETDLTADGQRALEQGLAFAWPASLESYAIQQQAHNALGGLWCCREEFDISLQHLKTAAELYNKTRALQQGSSTGSISKPGADSTQQQEEDVQGSSSSSSSPCWEAALVDGNQVEQQYTTTLYYMAQVYGHAGDRVLSAAYCAATLNRQLKEGIMDVNEWVQNCLQLSGYFLDGNAFALSRYCCTAVESMLLQWHEKQQGDVSQPAAATNDQQQPVSAVQQQEQQQQAADSESETRPADGKSSSGAATGASKEEQQQQQDTEHQQDEQGKDQANKQTQQQVGAGKGGKPDPQQQPESEQGDGSSNRLQLALQRLDEDVAANVRLAFAKLQLYCLVASHERYIEGKQLQYSFAGPSDVPDVLRFDALPGLPQLSSLAWGDAALAADFEAALGLFKAALPWFREALHYYQLEGWVTEHCHILFEMSNLYRCLAGFEADPHKRCVMHRHRAKLLQPLEGQLSPTHYPGLCRSISLELGNIFREIGDIKAAAGWEPEKVTAAGVSAAQHYQLFLDSFKGPDGEWPAKVEQEMEQHYLSAAFCLARVLQASASQSKEPSGQVAGLEHAAAWLRRLVKYVAENSVSSWQQEAQLAGEMAELLQEKLALTARTCTGMPAA